MTGALISDLMALVVHLQLTRVLAPVIRMWQSRQMHIAVVHVPMPTDSVRYVVLSFTVHRPIIIFTVVSNMP